MKNEAHVLPRMLKSVLPLIDSYAIVDTGSTDDSIKVVKDFFDAYEIRGEIKVDTSCTEMIDDEEIFIYDKARNSAWDMIKERTGFALTIDCDEELILPPFFNLDTFKQKLSKCDSIAFTALDGDNYFYRMFLYRIRAGWKWEGAIHERLKSDNNKRPAFVSDIQVISRSEGGTWKSESIEKKYLRQVKILQREFDKSGNGYYLYQMGQAYKNAGKIPEAIECFRRRVELRKSETNPDQIENIGFSQYMIANLRDMSMAPYQETIFEYFKSFELDKERGESLYNAIIRLQDCGFWELSYILSKYAMNRYHGKVPFPQKCLMIEHVIYEKEIYNLYKESCIKTNRENEINNWS